MAKIDKMLQDLCAFSPNMVSPEERNRMEQEQEQIRTRPTKSVETATEQKRMESIGTATEQKRTKSVKIGTEKSWISHFKELLILSVVYVITISLFANVLQYLEYEKLRSKRSCIIL